MFVCEYLCVQAKVCESVRAGMCHDNVRKSTHLRTYAVSTISADKPNVALAVRAEIAALSRIGVRWTVNTRRFGDLRRPARVFPWGAQSAG